MDKGCELHDIACRTRSGDVFAIVNIQMELLVVLVKIMEFDRNVGLVLIDLYHLVLCGLDVLSEDIAMLVAKKLCVEVVSALGYLDGRLLALYKPDNVHLVLVEDDGIFGLASGGNLYRYRHHIFLAIRLIGSDGRQRLLGSIVHHRVIYSLRQDQFRMV